jgi:pilus assembly protein CpaF
MVHLGKTADGVRRVLEISEVVGMRDGDIALNPLFGYDAQGGLKPTGNSLINERKLKMKGFR